MLLTAAQAEEIILTSKLLGCDRIAAFRHLGFSPKEYSLDMNTEEGFTNDLEMFVAECRYESARQAIK